MMQPPRRLNRRTPNRLSGWWYGVVKGPTLSNSRPKRNKKPDAITGRNTKLAHTAVQQPATAAVPRLPRLAVVETESDTDSSGSSNDPNSAASTQHLMPGAKMPVPAPNSPKQKQQQGGDPPSPSL
ncbi:UNVERIFIED_CONTAM: hypothetical protein Sradi_6124100 [Sesamum radiatum]|uniref:Uncharacterized protein n=1 Tax=Sesamum radiatum TaxID=300843 RepID=A0AAW2KKU3_SESRA